MSMERMVHDLRMGFWVPRKHCVEEIEVWGIGRAGSSVSGDTQLAGQMSPFVLHDGSV
jgi:hypothetical protein